MVFKWTLDAAGTLIHLGLAVLCLKLVPNPFKSGTSKSALGILEKGIEYGFVALLLPYRHVHGPSNLSLPYP